jgi:hypothetical protein
MRDIETLTEVMAGVVVATDGISVMLVDVATLTLTLATVETVTVIVGVGGDKNSQAVEMREHRTGPERLYSRPPPEWSLLWSLFWTDGGRAAT